MANASVAWAENTRPQNAAVLVAQRIMKEFSRGHVGVKMRGLVAVPVLI